MTPDLWGAEVHGDRPSVYPRGSLHEMIARVIGAWPTIAEDAEAQRRRIAANAEAQRRMGPFEPEAWLAEPMEGYVRLPGLLDFACQFNVTWVGAEDGSEMTPAQMRAARALVEHGPSLRDQLVEALIRDQRDHAESGDFPKVETSWDVLETVPLESIEISRDEHEHVAYVDVSFEDCWRDECGLAAVILGDRVVVLGGSTDAVHQPMAAARPVPSKTSDGAYVAESWALAPCDGPVALPMWERLRGRWKLVLLYEDDDARALTAPQRAAIARLLDDGEAVRGALLEALFADAASKAASPSEVGDAPRLGETLRAGRISVFTEDLDGLAYVAFTLEAPWRRSGAVTVVMHGARVVALTTRVRTDAAVAADQEAALAARAADKKPTSR